MRDASGAREADFWSARNAWYVDLTDMMQISEEDGRLRVIDRSGGKEGVGRKEGRDLKLGRAEGVGCVGDGGNKQRSVQTGSQAARVFRHQQQHVVLLMKDFLHG